ncbi:unnamed protein product [Rhizoctonia solani]|uniref:Transmembrane protein n=1 Tax=Rhizoctonia solani TaxID=456999 RepID=A0A8H3CDM3_9AGAM|nr:unnamed protein product [Rhizoctonia solani]
MAGHPCERGRRCSCHRAGPSTRRKKTTLLAAAAALVCPVLAAPTPRPTDLTLPFLYPSLERRAKDAGQAPDDPSEGFTHQHIQLADLIRAGLPYKYVYDSSANVSPSEMEEELQEANGAWVIDNAWSLHGRRFGPLYATATATAGITDDPLPTPTESIPPASTPTSSTTAPPTMLAIQSTLPTGWDATPYARSNMYAIPLVVSFSLVIALMIGSLIGALVIRRDRSRSRRRKKRIIEGDDDSIREKVVQSSLVSRVGRALKQREQPDEPEDPPQTELEHRVKTWARRSAAWRVQARIGVRRRITRGRKRSQADPGPGPMGGAIQEEPEPEEEARSTRPSLAQSRAPTPIVDTRPDPPEPAPGPAPNYASPTVPNYVTPTVPTYSSPDAGPSTPLARTERPDPLTRIDAHPDATPSDEPAYDGPGSGDGLPPAYRGGGLSEVARGKRPAHISESVHEAEQEREERRVWTELDAYAYGQGRTEQGVTAHVATDDKRVLERLHLMRGAPENSREEGEVRAPREEDVFGCSTPSGSPTSGLSGAGSVPGVGTGVGPLPLPPSKTGTGPVARYGEADLCLPRYLDGEGMPGEGVGMVPSVPPGEEEMGLPSAPPCHEAALPSAPPCHEDSALPSAPVFENDSGPVPSAPPIDDHPLPSAPALDGHFVPSVPAPAPSAPTLDGHSAPAPDDHSAPAPDGHSAPTPDDHLSAPLHDDKRPDDRTHTSTSAPQLRRLNSSCPLLGDEQ